MSTSKVTFISVCKSNACKRIVRTDEASYVWTIEDFDLHEANGKRLYSHSFSSMTNDRIKWYIRLDPSGTRSADADAKNHVNVYLLLSKLSNFEKNMKICARFVFSVLKSGSEEEFKQPATTKEFLHPDVSVSESGWGWRNFVKKDAKFRNQMLSNNALTIRCEVKFSNMNDVTRNYNQCDCDIKLPKCNLSENLASLFENQAFTDVVLSVNGANFPAHKTVLAARSSVFCAMFTHTMKEKELNRIDIEDISADVVGEMLKYMYTGKCLNLDKFAEGLLAAADKYDLYQLKMMCAKSLFDGLSVENAASVLALADMHGVKELKNNVIRFIVSKATEVTSTEGWKSIQSNFELADEVCLAIANQFKQTTD